MKVFKNEGKRASMSAALASLLVCSEIVGTNAKALDISDTGASDGKDIVGYQTEWQDYYSVNVTWGNMTFVYDRGAYNPTAGIKTRASDEATYIGAEAGKGDKNSGKDSGEYEQINCWYGFNGTNNKVEIENISTGKVIATATTNLSDVENMTGDSKLQLYFAAGSNWEGTAEGETAAEFTGVNHNTDTTMNTYGEGKAMKVTLEQQAFNADGTLNAETPNTGAKNLFYLNITGAPGSAFSEDIQTPSKLGDITLNFVKSST